jgi:hypothetical protein
MFILSLFVRYKEIAMKLGMEDAAALRQRLEEEREVETGDDRGEEKKKEKREEKKKFLVRGRGEIPSWIL